jgi:hypothetical protein
MSEPSVFSRFDRAKRERERERERDLLAEENAKRMEEYRIYAYKLWERTEYYAFLFVGSYLWYYIVFKVLDWHRFPVHLYPLELWGVVVVPILLIILLLYVLDTYSPTKVD